MAGIALNRSRQVPAEDTPAFGGIAERFRRAGDLDRAIQLCRDGLKKFPDHLSARVTLGWALLDQGKYDDARVELEQALKRAPDNLAAIRGLAELHDRAEHTMMLPMDGPGQWPPDADAIDSIQTEPAADAAAFDFSLKTQVPAAPVVEEIVARVEPVAPVAPEEPAAPEPAPARRKVKAGARVAARAARAEAARALEAKAAPAPQAAPEPAVVFEPAAAAPAVAAPVLPPEIVLTNSAGLPLSASAEPARPAPASAVPAAPAPAVATRVAPAPVAPASVTPPAAAAPVAPAPAKAAAPPVQTAPVAQAPAVPPVAPPAVTEEIAPVEIETPASAVARVLASVVNPELATVEVAPPSARSAADDSSGPSLVEQMLTTPVIEPPRVEPVVDPSDETALDEAIASLADFAPLNIDTRAPSVAAGEPAAVDLDLSPDLSLEAAMRDLVPAGTDPAALSVVLDDTSAPDVNLDQLVEQLAAVDEGVIAAPVLQTSAGLAADVPLNARVQDADVTALIAEAAALEDVAEISAAPVRDVPVVPSVDLLAEPEDDPARPALVLTNPTLEDFPDPAVAEEAEAALLVSGDVEVNELPLLTAFVNETIAVDAEAVAAAQLTPDVPAGPMIELTSPTEADFPEPVDLDEDEDTENARDAAAGSGELPGLALLASLPDEPDAIEPDMVESEAVEPVVVAAARSARIPLERFLRQVQTRRAQLMSQSVA